METVGLELAFDAVAGAAAAGSFRITALNHEVLDNAVENNAVIEMFLDQADEVVDGFGSNIGIKLRFHDAAVFHGDSYDRIFLCHHKYPQPGNSGCCFLSVYAGIYCNGKVLGSKEMIRKWTDRDAVVWLSDEKKEIERLKAAGQCCVYVITEQNRDKAAPKTRWCLELDSGQDDLDAQWLYRVWQRHEGLPWEIARTKRLILREMTEADLDALYEIQSGEDDSPFLEPLFEDRDRQLAQIRDEIRYQYGFYEFGIWMVELAESHTVIGRAGLQLRDGYGEPELGFIIAPAYRGHGYAREACEAVLQVAREELFFETIRAVVHRDNEKSLRLCKKLGFIVDNKAEKDENPWIFLRKSLK